MNGKIIIVVSLLLAGGCGSKKSHLQNFDKKDNSVEEKENDPKTVLGQKVASEKIANFLSISDASKETFRGYLQGVNKTDSSGPYVIREFVSDSLSFQLIFFPNDLDKNSVDFHVVEQSKHDNYQKFTCFAFVFPMNDNSKSNDYHTDNTPYPVNVKSFVRKDTSWIYYSSSVGCFASGTGL